MYRIAVADLYQSAAAVDGWNSDCEYRVGNQAHVDHFLRQGRIQTRLTQGPTTNFDCDIVYTEGAFLMYPEGAQTQ